ncbi:MAG TPA: hypothetical protein VF529_03670 [Solirubrobacteraceae bacterium]|jgi:hypothetical protein
MTQRERRKLTAVDDPLETTSPAAAPAARMSDGPTRRPGSAAERQALFVRLPGAEAESLARAAFELRLHKREIVAALIARHVDAASDAGLEDVRQVVEEYRGAHG